MRSLISRAFDELSPDRVRSTVEGALTNFFWDPQSHQTLPVALEEWARERPRDPFLWFEGRERSVGEVAERTGMPRADVERLFRMVMNTEFKRYQYAPTVRVSERCWSGRRYPVSHRFDGGH